MARDWVSVFVGPRSEALVLQGALEAVGIATFVPDETMRAIHPFETAASRPAAPSSWCR